MWLWNKERASLATWHLRRKLKFTWDSRGSKMSAGLGDQSRKIYKYLQSKALSLCSLPSTATNTVLFPPSCCFAMVRSSLEWYDEWLLCWVNRDILHGYTRAFNTNLVLMHTCLLGGCTRTPDEVRLVNSPYDRRAQSHVFQVFESLLRMANECKKIDFRFDTPIEEVKVWTACWIFL